MSRAPSPAPDDRGTAPTETDHTLPLDDMRDPSPPPIDEDPPVHPPVDGDPKRDLLYRTLRMLQKEIVSFIIISLLMLF